MAYNVPALGEVANFGTDYFLLNYNFFAKCERELTTKFAILPNGCWKTYYFLSYLYVKFDFGNEAGKIIKIAPSSTFTPFKTN